MVLFVFSCTLRSNEIIKFNLMSDAYSALVFANTIFTQLQDTHTFWSMN